MRYELAEVNVARLAASLGSPQLADFMDALVPLNALADSADGFCWRLQTAEGDAHRPTTDEAEDRVGRLRADGPTQDAFTLKSLPAALRRRSSRRAPT